MASSSTMYRKARQWKKEEARNEQAQKQIAAGENHTEAERKVDEQMEAAALLREFLATEI